MTRNCIVALLLVGACAGRQAPASDEDTLTNAEASFISKDCLSRLNVNDIRRSGVKIPLQGEPENLGEALEANLRATGAPVMATAGSPVSFDVHEDKGSIFVSIDIAGGTFGRVYKRVSQGTDETELVAVSPPSLRWR